MDRRHTFDEVALGVSPKGGRDPRGQDSEDTQAKDQQGRVDYGGASEMLHPAVVVVGMFDLQRRGYGVAKGIPSLVVAAASFDDVMAISGFSIVSGTLFASGSDSSARNTAILRCK